MKKKKKKKGQKKKIKFKLFNIIFFLIIIGLFMYYTTSFINVPITNIYIKNNDYLSDNDIINIADIKDYPGTFTNSSITIKKRLEKNKLIKSANVKKKYFTRVYIDVYENTPLFFNSKLGKTVLKDGYNYSDTITAPYLVNDVPDKLYNKLITKMNDIDYSIIKIISEIKYDPDDVDKQRFLFSMNDGNYVYTTLSNFKEMNDYLKYIKEFNNKKGILYLNSGEYFKIMEN